MNTQELQKGVEATIEYLKRHGVEVTHTLMLKAITQAFGGPEKFETWELPEDAVPEWDPASGEMSQEQFNAAGCRNCPMCGSDKVYFDRPGFDPPNVWSDSSCGACEATWITYFWVSGFDNLEPVDHPRWTNDDWWRELDPCVDDGGYDEHRRIKKLRRGLREIFLWCGSHNSPVTLGQIWDVLNLPQAENAPMGSEEYLQSSLDNEHISLEQPWNVSPPYWLKQTVRNMLVKAGVLPAPQHEVTFNPHGGSSGIQ